MEAFTASQWLFYGGIVVMASALLLSAFCVVAFFMTGKALRRRLEEEYGKQR